MRALLGQRAGYCFGDRQAQECWRISPPTAALAVKVTALIPHSGGRDVPVNETERFR
jgi:hypothetical protein